jgi:hypothetical protein
VSIFFSRLKALKQTSKLPLLALLLVGTISLIWGLHTVTAQTASNDTATDNKDETSLVEAFRHVEVASVSDALEDVYVTSHEADFFKQVRRCSVNGALEKRRK